MESIIKKLNESKIFVDNIDSNNVNECLNYLISIPLKTDYNGGLLVNIKKYTDLNNKLIDEHNILNLQLDRLRKEMINSDIIKKQEDTISSLKKSLRNSDTAKKVLNDEIYSLKKQIRKNNSEFKKLNGALDKANQDSVNIPNLIDKIDRLEEFLSEINQKGKRKDLTPSLKKEILTLNKYGLSKAQISLKTGISEYMISKVINA